MKSDSARGKRLAAALKENLKRRKAQALARTEDGTTPEGRDQPGDLAGEPAIRPKAAPKRG